MSQYAPDMTAPGVRRLNSAHYRAKKLAKWSSMSVPSRETTAAGFSSLKSTTRVTLREHFPATESYVSEDQTHTYPKSRVHDCPTAPDDR